MAALLVGLAAIVFVLSLPGSPPLTGASAPTPTPSPTATVTPDPVIAVLSSDCTLQPPGPGLPSPPPLQRCTGSARVIADQPIGPVHVWVVFENAEGQPFYGCRGEMLVATAPGMVMTWTITCDTDEKTPASHRLRFTSAEGEELPSRDDRQR